MMNNALEVRGLRKNYRDFSLQDITFTLPEGFIMGLIGPNGAGKTTIIKSIMNLIRKDSGSISIFAKDHIEYEVDVKARIGFVYDNPNYYEHLNLKQMKKFIAPFYDSWDEALFCDLVKRFDLPLKKRFSKYSRGMVMKAALAIALSHHADLIIMDEPTSGLDPVFRRELLDLFYEILQNEKKSILFSTHITSDLERIADYITMVIDGRIVFSSVKDELMQNYALVKGDNGLLTKAAGSYFKGMRQGEFGFEALTDDVETVKKEFGAGVVIDRVNLDDIMYFLSNRGNYA
jgi:ABC-2 type transport system ATP-binding protein